jgi:hypothetical protein
MVGRLPSDGSKRPPSEGQNAHLVIWDDAHLLGHLFSISNPCHLSANVVSGLWLSLLLAVILSVAMGYAYMFYWVNWEDLAIEVWIPVHIHICIHF